MSNSITLECRACGQKNRLPVDKTLRDLGAAHCGGCHATLFLVSGEALPHVEAEALSHPYDRQALDKLKAVPYADTLLEKAMGATFDKLARFQLLAGAVEVSEKQAPRLWSLYLEAAGRINIDPPPLFIVQDPRPNAFASGAGEPLIAVTTGALDHMNEREVVAILGHELTHVKLGHVLYRTLALLMIQGGLGLLGRFLGIAKMLAMPLQLAILRWYQMAELSADRGELVATGSLETTVRTHMLMAGGTSRWIDELDVGAFIDQADEAEALRDEELFVYALEMLSSAQRTHPLPAWRVHHVLRFARSEAFFDLVAGRPPRALPEP